MKLTTMGFLDKDDLKDLRNQPCLVLVGTPDEIRAAAPLLYKDVTLAAALPSSVEGEKK